MLAQDLQKIQDMSFPAFKFISISDLFNSQMLTFIFAIAGILLLIYLLIGGLQMMFAKGDPKAVQASWAKITNAVIGFVIVFAAYWIVQLVGSVLNIKSIQDIFRGGSGAGSTTAPVPQGTLPPWY